MMRAGLLAAWSTPEGLLHAAMELRRRGYRKLEAFTPYPVHGLEKALRLPRSAIGWMVFPIAVAGALFAYWVQWFCNAVDYPLNAGGRPAHAPPAFVPITFETMVLAASIGGVVVFLVVCGLPRLHHPVFEVHGFERASIDEFWIGIDEKDPALDPRLARRHLEELGAIRIAWAGEAEERA